MCQCMRKTERFVCKNYYNTGNVLFDTSDFVAVIDSHDVGCRFIKILSLMSQLSTSGFDNECVITTVVILLEHYVDVSSSVIALSNM